MSCFRDSFKKLSEAQCPHSEVSEAFLCLAELLGVVESEDRKVREGRGEVGRDRKRRERRGIERERKRRR